MSLKVTLITLLVSVCLLTPSWACEFVDRFHQVTAIRGQVVGRSLGPLQFRWLRQCFSVGDAILTLYEYRSPAKLSELRRIAEVKSDSHGKFDFGRLMLGHYYLKVKGSEELNDWFEVEVTDQVKATQSILIDISPIHPDCTGGHEFNERKQ